MVRRQLVAGGGPWMYQLLEKVIGPIFKWKKKTCILVVKRRG